MKTPKFSVGEYITLIKDDDSVQRFGIVPYSETKYILERTNITKVAFRIVSLVINEDDVMYCCSDDDFGYMICFPESNARFAY